MSDNQEDLVGPGETLVTFETDGFIYKCTFPECDKTFNIMDIKNVQIGDVKKHAIEEHGATKLGIRDVLQWGDDSSQD